MQPDGEGIRRAVRWVSDQRKADPSLKLAKVIDEAAQRFDLSPLETDFLWRALTNPAPEGAPGGR
jgi:hypothetical protein